MNDIFNFRRFGLYARKELSEHWKAYALGVVAVLAVVGYHIYNEWIFVHSIYYRDSYVVGTHTSYVILMPIGAWLAGCYLLIAYSKPSSTFAALTLPVSAFERFLYAWLVACPICIATCFLVWKAGWSLAIPYFLRDLPSLILEEKKSLTSAVSEPGLYFLMVSVVGGNALFMLGAMALGRLNFLKTLGIIIVVGIVFVWADKQHLQYIFSDVYNIRPNTPVLWVSPNITIESPKKLYSNNLDSIFANLYKIWWLACLPLLLYVITFLKMKEKEI